jgi:GNAT superfamily N-acetyltransferase
MEPILRRVTERDLPAIRALRLEVGWQAHDWALRDAMRPPHAAFFGVDEGGRLVAIGSGIAYGRLGIVGNMVVAADRRRAGLGSRVLEAVLEFLEQRGAERVELFATADGRHLYQRFGFAPLMESAMVLIPRDAVAAAAGTSEIEIRSAGPDDLARISAYDLPRYGADRSPILSSALADPERPALVALREGALAGYAVLRPAGSRIGPWLADGTVAAGALLRGFAGVPPGEPLSTNLPGENGEGRDWLARLGAGITPTDGRMARGREISRRLDTIYGNAIGALG